jgi:transposase
MNKYPSAVIEKAKKQEKLLQARAAGKTLAQARAIAGIAAMTVKEANRLQRKYEAGGRTWEALLDGRFGHDIKANSAIKEWLYERKRQDPAVRASQLVKEIKEKFGVEFKGGHINYLLRKEGLTAPVGRPEKKKPAEAESKEEDPPEESPENAGVFFPGSGERSDGRR